ncbi:WUSCHEL-related homeobox 9 [Nymphaea thermarum]|nr:WUSCHEL-related homeobox 9 [Nymphaea thermarum]
MASSNRHWPSMFKSKPCNSHHHQWQHDIISACQKQPYSSGDANVFYWFQNRKSRSKHKQRHLSGKTHLSNPTSTSVAATPPPQMNTITATATAAAIAATTTNTATVTTTTTTTTNSSSSSERTSSSAYLNAMESVNSPSTPTASVNQTGFYQPALHQFPLHDPRPFFFQNSAPFPSLSAPSSLSELSSMVQLHEQLKQDERLNVVVGSPHQNYAIAPLLQDLGCSASSSARLTVFINDLAFEVAPMPVNVREAFGEEAVLLHSSGQPV